MYERMVAMDKSWWLVFAKTNSRIDKIHEEWRLIGWTASEKRARAWFYDLQAAKSYIDMYTLHYDVLSGLCAWRAREQGGIPLDLYRSIVQHGARTANAEMRDFIRMAVCGRPTERKPPSGQALVDCIIEAYNLRGDDKSRAPGEQREDKVTGLSVDRCLTAGSTREM